MWKSKKIVFVVICMFVIASFSGCTQQGDAQIVKNDYESIDGFPASLPYGEKTVNVTGSFSQAETDDGQYTICLIVRVDCAELNDDEFMDFVNRYCYISADEYLDGETDELLKLGGLYSTEDRYIDYVFITSSPYARNTPYNGDELKVSFVLAVTDTPELVERLNVSISTVCPEDLLAPDDVIQGTLKSFILDKLQDRFEKDNAFMRMMTSSD